ncbi:MAG: hypothetical protein AAF035_11345 [Pseudomonadota bacterium]
MEQLVKNLENPRHTMPIDDDLRAMGYAHLFELASRYGTVSISDGTQGGYSVSIRGWRSPTGCWSSDSDWHDTAENALREAVQGMRHLRHELLSVDDGAPVVQMNPSGLLTGPTSTRAFETSKDHVDYIRDCVMCASDASEILDDVQRSFHGREKD